MAQIFPEWDVWTQFVTGDMASGLSLDSLRSSHPIEVDVGHPKEINEIFDAISYSKGASLIRMLTAFLGAEAFKTGIRTYLKGLFCFVLSMINYIKSFFEINTFTIFKNLLTQTPKHRTYGATFRNPLQRMCPP